MRNPLIATALSSGDPIHLREALTRDGAAILTDVAPDGVGAAAQLAVSLGACAMPVSLVDLGMSPDARVHCPHGTPTPVLGLLATCGEGALVAALTRRGANVDARDDNDDSVLMRAVRARQQGIARYLLRAGADPDLGNAAGRTPLMQAAMDGDASLIDILLAQRAALGCVDDEANTAAHYAALHGGRAALRSLLAHGASADPRNAHGETPLHYAARLGRRAEADLLLEYGAEPRSADSQGLTPCARARERGHTCLAERIAARERRTRLHVPPGAGSACAPDPGL